MTLREVLTSFKKLCPIEFSLRIIERLAETIRKMATKGVVHGHITQDTIGMVRSKSVPGGFKVSKLGGFEFAFFAHEPVLVQVDPSTE